MLINLFNTSYLKEICTWGNYLSISHTCHILSNAWSTLPNPFYKRCKVAEDYSVVSAGSAAVDFYSADFPVSHLLAVAATPSVSCAVALPQYY